MWRKDCFFFKLVYRVFHLLMRGGFFFLEKNENILSIDVTKCI